MADFQLDQGRIQFGSREETEKDQPTERDPRTAGEREGKESARSRAQQRGTEAEQRTQSEREQRGARESEAREQAAAEASRGREPEGGEPTATQASRDRKFMEEHPAGYLAARQTVSGPLDEGATADRGLGGGFDHGRGIWGAPGVVQNSAAARNDPMEGLNREQTLTERTGHPDVRDEPGYGAHGLERLNEGPHAFDLSGGETAQVSDERLRGEIARALGEEPELDARGVAVSVRDAEVFLRGSVPEPAMRARAEQVSRSFQGVRLVHNELSPNR